MPNLFRHLINPMAYEPLKRRPRGHIFICHMAEGTLITTITNVNSWSISSIKLWVGQVLRKRKMGRRGDREIGVTVIRIEESGGQGGRALVTQKMWWLVCSRR